VAYWEVLCKRNGPMNQKKVTSKQLLGNANDIHLGGNLTVFRITYRYLYRLFGQLFFVHRSEKKSVF
jgi:hypothetical protein